jgi:hypothetical protein
MKYKLGNAENLDIVKKVLALVLCNFINYGLHEVLAIAVMPYDLLSMVLSFLKLSFSKYLYLI